MSAAWDARPPDPADAPPLASDAPAAAPDPFAGFCAELADVLARPAERKRNLVRLAEALARLADASVALWLPGAGGTLACEVGTGELAQTEGDLVPDEGTLEGEAFRARQPRHAANLRADPRAFLPQQRDLPNTAAVAIPLVAGGECAGVATFAARRRDRGFSGDELAALEPAVVLVAGALRNFAAHEKSRASRTMLEAIRSARPRDSRVLRAVRHELNTPVSVIHGTLQLYAGEWGTTPAELREAITFAAERLQSLSRLLQVLEESDSPVDLDPEGRFKQS